MGDGDTLNQFLMHGDKELAPNFPARRIATVGKAKLSPSVPLD